MKVIEHALDLEEKLHPHRLRKSFATFAKRLHLDPQYAQKVTAHEEIEMLLDVYTHVDEEEAKEAYSKISFLNGHAAPTASKEEAIRALHLVIQSLGAESAAMVVPVLEGVIKMLETIPNHRSSATIRATTDFAALRSDAQSR